MAIGAVSSPLDSFVVAESLVLRTNFCAEKPAHRQSAKRQAVKKQPSLFLLLIYVREKTPAGHFLRFKEVIFYAANGMLKKFDDVHRLKMRQF